MKPCGAAWLAVPYWNRKARIYGRDFAPGGFLESQMKDINHVMETAQELDVPLLLAPMVQQITESLMQEAAAGKTTAAW